MAIFWIETCRGLKLMRNLNFINYAKDTNEDLSEILIGLQNEEQKKINSKFFYDDKGSRLFDKITKSSDYYPTKKELEIFEKKYQEIKTYLPSNSVVIEFGSGSNKKISKLLSIIEKPEEYISIDISKEFLLKNAKELATNFPNIKITAVCADFGDTYNLSKVVKDKKSKIGFFPGSTIGNFCPNDAKDLLIKFSKILGSDNYLIIGVDLKKDEKILEKAYNDSEGITALFNKNILDGINKTCGTLFDTKNFDHRAFFNKNKSRIEMHLVSKTEQTVEILNEKITFKQGESIHTENSYKYSVNSFKDLAESASFEIKKVLTDQNSFFGVFFLKVKDS